MKRKIKYLLGGLIVWWEKIKKESKGIYNQVYYYKKIYKIGKACKFTGDIIISGTENIEFGNNVRINTNALIRGEGGLYIGDNTHISRNLVIYTVNHNYKGKRLPYDDTFIYKKVTIGRNVWIGINVTILPGAHIEEGAIIGAGSVVHGKVPKGAIIGASKGNIVKYRDMEKYYRLVKQKKIGGRGGTEFDINMKNNTIFIK